MLRGGGPMRCWWMLGLVACGGGTSAESLPFQVDGVAVAASVVDQAIVSGAVTLVTASGAGGTDAEAVFYSDDYLTEIGRTTLAIGTDLAEPGDVEGFELTTITARLLPHEDGHARVCVELRVARSSYEPAQQVGCVDGVPEQTTPTNTTPAPEEPPTAEVYEPFALQLYGIGESVDVDGRCTDPNQGNGSLEASWTWELDGGGGATEIAVNPIDGQGYTWGTWDNPPLGDYVITLTCTDAAGTSDVEARSISVVDRQLTDLDGDGFTPYSGDCDDSDPLINPDATEIPGNADDEDCDGYTAP